MKFNFIVLAELIWELRAHVCNGNSTGRKNIPMVDKMENFYILCIILYKHLFKTISWEMMLVDSGMIVDFPSRGEWQ